MGMHCVSHIILSVHAVTLHAGPFCYLPKPSGLLLNTELINVHVCYISIYSLQLKNMISALFQSRSGGTRNFLKSSRHFGWQAIQNVYKREIERTKSGLVRRVPKLKKVTYALTRGHA